MTCLIAEVILALVGVAEAEGEEHQAEQDDVLHVISCLILLVSSHADLYIRFQRRIWSCGAWGCEVCQPHRRPPIFHLLASQGLSPARSREIGVLVILAQTEQKSDVD